MNLEKLINAAKWIDEVAIEEQWYKISDDQLKHIREAYFYDICTSEVTYSEQKKSVKITRYNLD